MGENELEPLAKTRARRSNAGARMHEMIFNAEVDPQYAQAFGDLLKTDDDSSDDEEYVPKDLDTRNTNNTNSRTRARDDGGGDDEDEDKEDESNDERNSDNNSSDSNSCSDDDDDSDGQSDEDEEEDDEEYDEDADEDFDVNKSDKPKMDKKGKVAKIEIQTNASQNRGLNNNDLKPGSLSQAAYQACKKICSVCLGDKSGEDDEIIDCDSCGVSVHESCYGVLSDNADDDNDDDDEEDKSKDDDDAASTTNSNISSESTEPWFCEPCRRSVKNPTCELCPNLGGIFKETDTGRWVHMVCALYTRGVTFENVQTLTDVSLFELNYGLFGSKACTICEDRRLARSGICIGCDAGLCKIFFHATCAQKEGLLFESHADDIDPYFAQCKQHADKDIIKKKKKLFMALNARLRRIQMSDSISERISNKLSGLTKEVNPHLSKWNPQNRPPIPQRVSRMLLTSPSLILKLNKKSELMGLDTKSAFMNVHDEMEAARQKWHISPAFDLEFVAYCLDRTNRMVNMKKQNGQLVSQNLTLKNEEATLRDKYNNLKEVVAQLRTQCESLINEARSIQRNVANSNGKTFNLPLQMEQLIARCSFKKQHQSSNRTSQVKANSTYVCGKCGTVADQHLLALCDTCHTHIHIYCLDPPLTRVPKKTKFGGWQCSDCTERDDDEEEEENAQEEQSNPVNGPRRLRKARPNNLSKKFKNEYWN